jgi:argininosuccinate synthase
MSNVGSQAKISTAKGADGAVTLIQEVSLLFGSRDVGRYDLRELDLSGISSRRRYDVGTLTSFC